MHTNRIRHALTVTATAAGVLLATMVGAPATASAAPAMEQASDLPCGWFRTNHDPQGTTSRYRHCADTFIMIRIHWSNGVSQRLCIEPWDNHPFWWDGDHVVVNAYYIPDRPRVIVRPDGSAFCAASQPTA